jgi:hypothetical protein
MSKVRFAGGSPAGSKFDRTTISRPSTERPAIQEKMGLGMRDERYGFKIRSGMKR